MKLCYITPMPRGVNIGPHIQQKIIDAFTSNERISEIAERFSISIASVWNVAHRHGLGPRNIKIYKLTWAERQKIISLYKEGMHTPDIAKRFGVSFVSICDLLERANIQRRLSAYANIRTLDPTVFDTITEESAYWIGFLMADCHVREGRPHRFELHLSKQDESQILAFRDFLKSDAGLQHSQHSVKISIRSNALIERLNKYGIGFNGVREPKPELAFDRHFWRGLIDGDGSLCMAPTPIIHLIGRLPVVEGFLSFVRQYVTTKRQPSQIKRCAQPTYQTAFSSLAACTIIRVLYADSHVHLPRKKLIADRILAAK